MDDSTTITPEHIYLTWQTRIRVLTNPNIWTSMLLVLGIPSLLVGIFFAVIAKRPEYALLVPLGFMSILFGIFVLVALAIDLFGGFEATFFLTSGGVRSVSGKGSRAAATTAVVAGALAGRPGVVGAGLLAESEQNVFIPWTSITKIKVRARRRFILVKREWGDKPIGLYATRENFGQVRDILCRHAGDKVIR